VKRRIGKKSWRNWSPGDTRPLPGRGAWDFSVRGGILDVYPPLYANPVRVEFFGDLVESIREFNPATQRSHRDLPELYLLPISEVIISAERLAKAQARLAEAQAGETLSEKEANWLRHRLEEGLPVGGAERWLDWFYDPAGTVNDYLPANTLWVWNGSLSLQRAWKTLSDEPWEAFFQGFSSRDYLLLEDLPLEGEPRRAAGSGICRPLKTRMSGKSSGANPLPGNHGPKCPG